MNDTESGSIPTNVPAEVRKTIKDGDVYYLAGVGSKESDIMFVTPSALAEEVEDEIKLSYGKPLKQKPGFLKGPAGTIFKDLAARCGLDMDKCFYTSICRWLLPRDIRLRPKKNIMALGMPAFMAEFNKVKPKIIVCLGKPVFEQIVKHVKGSVMDLNGAWFDASDLYSGNQPCLVYLMEDITKLVTKPEYIERFRQDLKAVKQMQSQINGVVIDKFPLEYETIHNKSELLDWLARMEVFRVKVLSVDCEWHGNNHIDGNLRSIQFCWAPGKAVYIRFMDEDLNYVFDCSYKEAGELMKVPFDLLDMKFIGHHVSADLPWMHHVLGLDWYNKAIFDSEYGQQCVDEYEPLGLERMSLKYTDLGRYDIELYLWRKDKKNKEKADGGFGRIPDRILIPYACKDVDVVMRAWPRIMEQMGRQPGLVDYYNNTFNPFVTNFFTSYALNGLPMDIKLMDELRDLYSWVRDEMIIEFRQMLLKEAESMMLKQMSQFGLDGILAFDEMREHLLAGNPGDALSAMKKVVGAEKLSEVWPFYEHLLIAPYFNINNSRQKQRWLFEVKKFTPVKSTGNKEKGTPSVSWDKVMTYAPEKQKEFNPSADGQTIEILQTQYSDPLLKYMLQLMSISTVCKVFLKEAIVDEDGEVIKEQGLHFWLASDGRVHGQMSSTETGRPRSWKPNSLNWPSWVNKKISEGMANLLIKRLKEGHIPDKFRKYLPDNPMDMKEEDVLKYVSKAIPPIRACVVSPDGWCIVESDYQTAELRGQAFLSACDDMMDLITKPDKNFVRVKAELMADEDCVVRLGYPEYMPESQRDPKWLGVYGVDGVVVRAYEPDDYLRDESGNLVYAKQDLHWSLAEMVQKKPRESLVKKRDRNAAKVGNFCLAEGEMVLTQRGPIPIEKVLCCDLLWDGVEWVSHGGVICTGTKEVVQYQGLSATDNHEVWTEEKGKVSFGEARLEQLTLVRTTGPSESTEHTEHDSVSRNTEEGPSRLLQCPHGVSLLPCAACERTSELRKGAFREVSVRRQGQVSRYPSENSEEPWTEIRSYAATMQPGHSCFELQLQGPWDKGIIQLTSGVRVVGTAKMARGGLRGEGLRQNGQRWTLLKGQPETGGPYNELTEQERNTGCEYRALQGVHAEVSGGDIHGENCAWVSASGVVGGKAVGASQNQSKGCRKTKVYDILNAGPRHRFTCSGVLVSNSSAYGATGQTLERKIEADTGIKPEPGVGDALLAALEERQPRATAWLKSLEQCPLDPGFMQALSGRIRHFYTHPDSISGLSQRTRDGQVSALGREARNFPMQESVAATACRASRWLMEFGLKHGLKGFVLTILYDSVVTMCPENERLIWAKAHRLFMFLRNGWNAPTRVLRYPIDTELNRAWSWKPSKEDKEKWTNDNYEATPEYLKKSEEWLDSRIQLYESNEELSIF